MNFLRHLRNSKMLLVLAFALCCALVLIQVQEVKAQTPPLEKRTLYVIGSHSGMFRFPLQAYILVQSQLYLADTWQAQDHDLGAVGLAVDETNENLFVSYESFDGVEVFDARDATSLGTISLYGTSDLAGMVVHQDRGHLYVVDRRMPDVFVFDTTTFSQLDHWILPGGNTAVGLDLLGNLLFVSDGSSTIRWYDIDTKLEVGSFTQSNPAVGIAVTDWPVLSVYTVADIVASSNYLTQYLVDTDQENLLPVGNGKGVTLNPALDVAYVSVDNKILTIDTVNMQITDTKNLNLTWSPADVLTSFVPFGGTVKKTCTSHPNGKIYKGDTVTFKIEIQNRHPMPIHEMALTDTYDTSQLSFVSANPPTDDNNDDGQVDWADVIAQRGADLNTGEWAEVTAEFIATEDCGEEMEIEGTNIAQIHDVFDTEGTALPDATGEFPYIISCKCRTNLDCDDAVFCNGQETCDVQTGECSSPGNPCPLDDGMWCNGDETEECDEELDECGHENLPCEDDGIYCNGQEICNEDNDTCTNAGDPCVDDAQFCNGDESCDEENDQCLHSGDPCNPGEECNEAEDSCFDTNPGDDDTPDEDDGGDEDLWPKGKVTGGCCGC